MSPKPPTRAFEAHRRYVDSPTRVLAREPDDERLEFCVEGGANRTATRVGPVAPDQPAMPVQQGARRDDERRPRRSRQRPAQRGEQRAISIARLWPSELAARDRELMTQHKDLHLLALTAAQPQHEQPKHPAHRT